MCVLGELAGCRIVGVVRVADMWDRSFGCLSENIWNLRGDVRFSRFLVAVFAFEQNFWNKINIQRKLQQTSYLRSLFILF